MHRTHGSFIISGSFVKQLAAVPLGRDGRGQVDGDHLKQSFSGGQPATHHSLQQRLAFLILVLGVQLDVQLLDQLGDFLLLKVHDGIEHLEIEEVRCDYQCIRRRSALLFKAL